VVKKKEVQHLLCGLCELYEMLFFSHRARGEHGVEKQRTEGRGQKPGARGQESGR